MSRRELVKLFVSNNLDVRRYVTGVATGLTISIVIATASAIYWVARAFIRWVSSLSVLWPVFPDVSQDSLYISILVPAVILVFLFSYRISAILLRDAGGERSKSNENESQLTRALEALTEQLQAMQQQRKSEAKLDPHKPSLKITGRTGEMVTFPGNYRSVDYPGCVVTVNLNDLFPSIVDQGGPAQNTTWVLVVDNHPTLFDGTN